MITTLNMQLGRTGALSVSMPLAGVSRNPVAYGTTSSGRRIETTINSFANILDAINNILMALITLSAAIHSLKEMWQETSTQKAAAGQKSRLAKRSLRQVPTKVVLSNI